MAALDLAVWNSTLPLLLGVAVLDIQKRFVHLFEE
jgi:hypothetical protein